MVRWAQTTSCPPWLLLLLLMCIGSVVQSSRLIALLDDKWQKTTVQ